MNTKKMTNSEFSQTKTFIAMCETANVKPTTRQASKYRRGLGAVYQIIKKINHKVHVPDFAKLIVE